MDDKALKDLVKKARERLGSSKICDVEWIDGELVPIAPNPDGEQPTKETDNG